MQRQQKHSRPHRIWVVGYSIVAAAAVDTAAGTAAVVGTAAVGTAVDLPGSKPHCPVQAVSMKAVGCSFSVSSFNKLHVYDNSAYLIKYVRFAFWPF